MTRKQLKEKAALEAYPEKIMYSTLIEQNVDYNGRDRVIYKQGYDKGFDDAIEKTCEWLLENQPKEWPSAKVFVEFFRKHMNK